MCRQIVCHYCTISTEPLKQLVELRKTDKQRQQTNKHRSISRENRLYYISHSPPPPTFAAQIIRSTRWTSWCVWFVFQICAGKCSGLWMPGMFVAGSFPPLLQHIKRAITKNLWIFHILIGTLITIHYSSNGLSSHFNMQDVVTASKIPYTDDDICVIITLECSQKNDNVLRC